MAFFNSNVKVTLIDDATGEAFAETEMQPGDLPESFDLDTTLHLGSDDWTVVDAQPRNRAEYAKMKTLVLRLRRIQKVDPKDILYSLPSISDFIPGINEVPVTGRELLLAEDDWRQLEFVSNSLASIADDEIAKIRLIHETRVPESGWREIHARKQPVRPIAADLSLSELARSLQIPLEFAGVTYHGAPAQISDGYAFQIENMRIYGVAPKGIIHVIALEQYSETPLSASGIDRLRSFAQTFQLDLVNWCRCARVGPASPWFSKLLSNDAT